MTKNTLLLHFVIFNVKAEIDQLKGLKLLEVLDVLLKNSDVMKSLFTAECILLIAATLLELFSVHWSPATCDTHDAEEAVIVAWTEYTFSTEGNKVVLLFQSHLTCLISFAGGRHATLDEKEILIDLPKVLSFFTGASEIPPMGFPSNALYIEFEYDISRKRKLPYASTFSDTYIAYCFNRYIRIPKVNGLGHTL